VDDLNIFIEACDLGTGDLTFAVKDCIDVAGFATRAGSGCLDDATPATVHADIVSTLLERGGRIVGKVNMHELAYGVTGVNARYGTPANPRFPGLVPGGSSSGSAAAVASGRSRMAIGSDTGGSIRVPAACCGVFGLKPTFGRISRGGCLPAQSSLDCVGPFADTLADIELAMTLIDPTFEPQADGERPVLGVVDVAVADDVALAMAVCLAAGGVALNPVVLPGFADAYRAGMEIIGAENWRAFAAMIEDSRMGADVRARLAAASAIGDAALGRAEKVRQDFTAAVDAALEKVDALVLPTLPAVPPRLGAIDDDPAAVLALTSLVRPFNLSGHPVLSIPLRTREGMPAGLQLVGRKGEDARLCAAARFLLAGGAA